MDRADHMLRDRYYQAGHWTSESLWDTLETRALMNPGATAFIDDERALSYGELLTQAGALGCALARRGLSAGEPVIIVGRNVHASAVAMLGCWRQGLVAVPVPPMYSASQLAAIASNCNARVLLCTADGEVTSNAAEAARLGGLELLVTGTPIEGALHWPSLLAEGATGCTPSPGAPDAVAMLIYSSGTTGTPKGVMHSANTIRYTSRQIAQLHQIHDQDVILVVCQFGFIGSVVFGFLVSMLTGAVAVLMARWKPERALELIAQHRATYTLMMPTHIVDTLASPQLDNTDCRSLRRGILAGINAQQREHAARSLCTLPLPMFGMSECAGQTTCSVEDPLDKRVWTDGRPLPGAEIRILDDDGLPAKAGVAGHVLVRGPSRCLGYFGAKELTRDAMTEDGFFRTGDIGVLDADGYFTFGTRARDVIRRGGVTIVPSELEDQLARHPSVQHAAIVALPDARLGERACACVILRGTESPTLESLNAFLKSQGVSPYLLPELLLVFDEFPRTPSLKVKKVELAQLAQHRIDAQSGPLAEGRPSSTQGTPFDGAPVATSPLP